MYLSFSLRPNFLGSRIVTTLFTTDPFSVLCVCSTHPKSMYCEGWNHCRGEAESGDGDTLPQTTLFRNLA